MKMATWPGASAISSIADDSDCGSELERVLHSEARQPADGADIWAQIGRRDGAVAHLKGELPGSSLGAARAGGAEH